MKNRLIRFTKQSIQVIARLVIVLTGFTVCGQSAHSQILTTTPASRCGAGTLVLGATATSGTIKWYTTPFYGTAIATGTSLTTPSQIVTTAYYVDAVDGSDCSLNTNRVRVPVLATISSNSMQAIIFYASTTFCTTVETPQEVTRTGSAGGVFSYTGAEGKTLTLNTSTGAITPSSSNVGTYTVTYTVTASEGCVESPASTPVTIATAPLTSSISYSGTPYCTSLTSATVSLTNPNDGTFSASPSGLSIDAAGTINPSASQPGEYTVTYLVSGAGGCAPQSPTAPVTITGLPTAVIAYSGTPFCQDVATEQIPDFTGTGAYTGGAFSYSGTGTLASFSTSTGGFVPSTSTAGSYTIKYTAPASAGCAAVEVTTTATIYPLPTAGISGTTSVCQGAGAPNVTFTGAAGTAPYTFTYTVNGGGNQTVTTSSGNSVTVSQSTGDAGSFAYTLASVTDAHGCTHSATGTETITVTPTPAATFRYSGSSYCKLGTATPSFIGEGIAGSFSKTAGDGTLSITAGTGVINLAASDAGTYTVTNTISSCGSVTSTADITINALPTATITGTLAACLSTTLTANSGASSPQYTWYQLNTETEEYDVIAGQNTATLAVDASGAYKVKVADGDTGCENTSAASTVTIYALPTASISGNLISCVSSTLTALTDATSPTYVWYKNNVAIEGQTSGTLSVTVSDAYTVKVTGSTGCSNTSLPATVTISAPAVAGTVSGGATVCTGGNSIELTAAGYSVAIARWESSTNGETWTPIDNTAATYTAAGLTATTYFRTVITSGTCAWAYPTPATITVVADPTLSQPGNASICKGGTTTLTTVASSGTGTFSYQWQYSANGTTGWANVADATPTGITYTNGTTASLTITGDGNETAQANYYKCLLTTLTPTGAGCDATTSAVTVTTVSDIAITVNPVAPSAVCAGGSFSPLTVTATGGTPSLTYQWYSNASNSNSGGTGLGSGSGAQTNSYTPPASTPGSLYYYCVVSASGSGCGSASSATALVTVNPLPTITTGGTAADVTYSASAQTTTLAYTATTNSPTSYSIDWTGMADQTSTSFTFISDGGTLTGMVVPAGTAVAVYSGTMTITNASGCTATQAVTLTVRPAAPTGDASQSFCSGGEL